MTTRDASAARLDDLAARGARRFHTGMAIALIAVVFAGFAPTYYLRGATGAPALGLRLHVHGAVFTAWLLLFFVQAALVAARRVDVHRRLGIAGALLGASMVPLGVSAAIDAAHRGVVLGAFEPRAAMIFPLGQTLLFAVFFGLAIGYRRRPELHRRLVLLAAIALVTPAIARLPFVEQRPVPSIALSSLFVVAAMIHDRRTRGRVHAAYLAGGLAIVLSGPLRFGLAHTSLWRSVAAWIAG